MKGFSFLSVLFGLLFFSLNGFALTSEGTNCEPNVNGKSETIRTNEVFGKKAVKEARSFDKNSNRFDHVDSFGVLHAQELRLRLAYDAVEIGGECGSTFSALLERVCVVGTVTLTSQCADVCTKSRRDQDCR
jgi:hypothetical protein